MIKGLREWSFWSGLLCGWIYGLEEGKGAGEGEGAAYNL